jgi:hypothetical protein
MLIDRASALAEKINAFQQLRIIADEADQFATRAKLFGNVCQQLKSLKSTLKTLEDAGIVVEFATKDGLDLAEKARLLRDEVKSNPAKLNDPPFDLKHAFSDRLSSIAAAGQAAALTAWTSYVATRANFGDDNVLAALLLVPQFKSVVLKIRQIRSEVSALGSVLPNDPNAERAKLDRLISEHETAWASLNASDIPASVIAFIRSAAKGDAMLTDFTQETRSWLESRNLVDAFRIKLR